MRVAVTGATGFLGRYLVADLIASGHECRCWFRGSSDRSGFEKFGPKIHWVEGDLGNTRALDEFVGGCDAVVHSALFHPGGRFMGGEGDLAEFLERNLIGTIRLIEAARSSGAERFVFISTCAVHDKILGDRALDETHPLWPASHYGAHKAAIEAFVHSYGLGQGYSICALRPTGIYGLAHRAHDSKWYDLVRAVVQGKDVECRKGGKEVHAADVASAAGVLLSAQGVAGEAFNCYDRYISEFEVASIAKQLTGSRSQVLGSETSPKNQILTAKLQSLGMRFGGRPILEQTVQQLIDAARSV